MNADQTLQGVAWLREAVLAAIDNPTEATGTPKPPGQTDVEFAAFTAINVAIAFVATERAVGGHVWQDTPAKAPSAAVDARTGPGAGAEPGDSLTAGLAATGLSAAELVVLHDRERDRPPGTRLGTLWPEP